MCSGEPLGVLFSGVRDGAGAESKVEGFTGSANRGCRGCGCVVCTISRDSERSSPTPDFVVPRRDLNNIVSLLNVLDILTLVCHGHEKSVFGVVRRPAQLECFHNGPITNNHPDCSIT